MQFSTWTPIQRKCLDRLTKQLVHEVFLDKSAISESPAFEGGVRKLDKVLNKQLDKVFHELKLYLWEASLLGAISTRTE